MPRNGGAVQNTRRHDGDCCSGMGHGTERKKCTRRPKYKTPRSNSFTTRAPSPTLPNNQGRDVGCLIFGARVATRCEGDVREEGSPSTHPPSCYNESCLLGRSETATHIQSVCACDGGLANSKVSPPQTLAQTKKKGARGCTQSATHEQVPASTPRPPDAPLRAGNSVNAKGSSGSAGGDEDLRARLHSLASWRTAQSFSLLRFLKWQRAEAALTSF